MLLNELFGDAYQRLSPQQFQLAYDAIKDEEKDFADLKKIAQEFEFGDYGRTKGSALFTLVRMHILVHGVAPYGITERSAETMFNTSKPMEDFVARMGHDVEENHRAAQEEWKNRPKKVKEPVARQMMSDFYMKHKNELHPEVREHREAIIKAIMNGVSPEQAFARFMVRRQVA